MANTHLRDRIATSAFAFRGYNVTNLGRSPELLAHHAYGPVVAEHLSRMSDICSEASGRKIDLIERVRSQQETDLDAFNEAIGVILAMELAQLKLLEQFFDIQWNKSAMTFGYSLGEVAALIATGVYELEEIAPAPLSMADECAELAHDTTMGVLFSVGPELDMTQVQRLCLEINAEGRGVVSMSAVLSPNTCLLLGQGDTIDRCQSRLRELFPRQVNLRKRKEKYPPLHTSLLWERNIPNRAARLMHTMSGGFKKPTPVIWSCVTGKPDYTDYNSREILNRWIDHPQRLWDAVCGTLSSGVETVVHVGPDPNLIPATFKRLSDNVVAQLNGRSLNSLSRRAIAGIARRPWLKKMVSQRATLLRAPFVEHIILEDWLLSQEVP